MQPSAMRRRVGGFTLIELLIVILILAILMSVALPLYLGAVANADKRACRANMQSIANAEAAYRTRSSTHAYTTDLSLLNTDLGATPVCPRGGTYSVTISDGTATANNGTTVPSGGLVISCTRPRHGGFAPGIDSD